MFTTTLASVVLATSLVVSGPQPEESPGENPTQNIVEVAAAAGSFNTLIAAVEAAGLAQTLAEGGPFTVFAPTDEAFAQIPQADLQALLADKEALAAVLTYHVVPGKVYARDVVGLTSATTVNGQSVQVKVKDGSVMIDGANVTATDIEATNGVIHVIDRVILPEM